MLALPRLEGLETQVSGDKKPQERPMFGTGVKRVELFGWSCSAVKLSHSGASTAFGNLKLYA